MAQRLDLNRFKLTGEPIRVAERIERWGRAPPSPYQRAVRWRTGLGPGASPSRRGSNATAPGAAPLGSPGGYMNVALSHDGQQAALDRFDATPGIWLLDAARGTAIRATLGKGYESTPVWSPDAGAFVFAAARDAPPNLYLKRIGVAGDGERLFGSAAQTLFPQSWSRDGNFIAYVSMDPKTERRHLGARALRRSEARPVSPIAVLGNARSNLARRSMAGVRLERVCDEWCLRRELSEARAQMARVHERRGLSGLAS